MTRFHELPLAAQTAYAELAEQARAFELSNALAGLKGSFQRMTRKGASYWYFAYRDLDQRVRMAYVGPDEPRVQRLIERFAAVRRKELWSEPVARITPRQRAATQIRTGRKPTR